MTEVCVMARAVLPNAPLLIDTFRLPAGRYANRTLCEVGSRIEGLQYLRGLLAPDGSPDFMRPPVIQQIVQSFISRPDRAKALHVADGKEPRRRRRPR
jgi:hypothetical protein